MRVLAAGHVIAAYVDFPEQRLDVGEPLQCELRAVVTAGSDLHADPDAVLNFDGLESSPYCAHELDRIVLAIDDARTEPHHDEGVCPALSREPFRRCGGRPRTGEKQEAPAQISPRYRR